MRVLGIFHPLRFTLSIDIKQGKKNEFVVTYKNGIRKNPVTFILVSDIQWRVNSLSDNSE